MTEITSLKGGDEKKDGTDKRSSTTTIQIQALKKEASGKRVSSKKDVLGILDPVPQRMNRKSTIMITNQLRFFTDTWEMEDPIGQPGAFGIAYICHKKQYPDTKFVVKQINKARFYHIDKKERDLILQNMSNEISLQKTLHHDHICLLYDVYEDRNYIHLVMDYLEGGELFDRICEADGFSEDQAAKIAKQILDAIAFMHSKNICHLDLKPDNILFETKDENSPIKVIDFGMAQVVPRLKKLKQTVGTPYYTAPEVLSGCYDRQADVWSIGVMIFCMLFGYPPFYVDHDEIKMGESEEEAIYNLVKKGFTAEVKPGYGPWFPEDIPVSDNARDLLGKMLRLNVKDRPTAAECMDHPWIRGGAHLQQLPRTVFSSLVNFNSTNRFKVVISRLFARHLEPERYAETVEVFKRWDKDGNGELSLAEFKTGMKQATKLSDEEIEKIFKHLDQDDNRTITIDELIVSSAFDALVAVDERMFDAFSLLDEDGDGELEVSELKKVLNDLQIKDLGRAESILAEIDADANGKIDYEEFLRALHPTLNEPNVDDMSRLKSKGFGSLDQNAFNKYVFRSKKAHLIDGSLDPNILIQSYSKAQDSGLLEEDIDTFGAEKVPPALVNLTVPSIIHEHKEDDMEEYVNDQSTPVPGEPATMTPNQSVIGRQESNKLISADVLSLSRATSRSNNTSQISQLSQMTHGSSHDGSVVDEMLETSHTQSSDNSKKNKNGRGKNRVGSVSDSQTNTISKRKKKKNRKNKKGNQNDDTDNETSVDDSIPEEPGNENTNNDDNDDDDTQIGKAPQGCCILL